MIVKKAGGKVIGAHLTNAEKKAMDIEIKKELAEFTRKYALEFDALFLWYMHEVHGFGVQRLKKMFLDFSVRVDEMCDRYDMQEAGEDVWLCMHKLKEIGADLEQWDKERGD